MYHRNLVQTLEDRLREPRKFIQVFIGPRQVGKTSMAQKLAQGFQGRVLYVSADEVTLRDTHWLKLQWDRARQDLSKGEPVLLILDEVQKVPDWQNTIKALWDEDSFHARPLQVLLLGSAPLLLQQGLSESLAGRFEMTYIPHWSYEEMRAAFGVSLDQYIYFGGYPGAADLLKDETRWRRYINDSLIETTISRDVMLLARINKPALLRRLFHLGCQYSGQILSYQKMLGQLQDVGNTTTLAHYAELLSAVGMLSGLQKYAGQQVRQKSSSPKWQVWNTALMSAQDTLTFESAKQDPAVWGRYVESAVGAYLLNLALVHQAKVYYWREDNQEVDFIVESSGKLLAVEVKSGAKSTAHPGLAAFSQHYPAARLLQVGGRDGIDLEEFFLSDPLLLDF